MSVFLCCSPEVSEQDGKWANVVKATRRGNRLLCFACDEKGATVGCFNGRCRHVYHVPCARSVGFDFVFVSLCSCLGFRFSFFVFCGFRFSFFRFSFFLFSYFFFRYVVRFFFGFGFRFFLFVLFFCRHLLVVRFVVLFQFWFWFRFIIFACVDFRLAVFDYCTD